MFKVLDEVCTPQRGTKYSAYVDLFAREDVTIGAGETKVIPLGVKIDLDALYDSLKNDEPEGTQGDYAGYLWEQFLKSHYLEVALRSSLSVKGLIIPNGIGIIDLDYPNEISLIIHNPITEISIYPEMEKNNAFKIENILFGADDDYDCDGDNFYIDRGDKVAQCTLKEHKGYLMGYESDVVRDGGFGSTDG